MMHWKCSEQSMVLKSAKDFDSNDKTRAEKESDIELVCHWTNYRKRITKNGLGCANVNMDWAPALISGVELKFSSIEAKFESQELRQKWKAAGESTDPNLYPP